MKKPDICNNVELINLFYTLPGRTAQKNLVVTKCLKKIVPQVAYDDDDFECIKVHKISWKGGKMKSAVTISALLHGHFHLF